MRRRDFSLAIAGAASMGLAVRARASAQSPDEDDYDTGVLDLVLAELAEIEGERIDAVGRSEIPATDRSSIRVNGTDAGLRAPALTAELRAAMAARNYWRLAPEQRPAPRWAPINRAPDYQHLTGFTLSSTRFELSGETLRLLAQRNSFHINDRRPVLLFGLRGCKIASGADAAPWARAHELEVIDPTHLDCRCVVGVLRKSDGMIALFRSSTVPAVASIYKALTGEGWGAGLLPTGLYAYRVGPMSGGVPARRGALLIAGQYCVLRTTDDLVFDAFSDGDVWSAGYGNHIHPGGSVARPDSAGGQVIPGGFRSARSFSAIGAWADFRRAAGLVGEDGLPVAADERASFQYMLLTGHEAAIADHYRGRAFFENGYVRLRPGSSGQAVRELQQRLFAEYSGIEGARVDGDFGMLTAFAVLLHKKDTEGEFTSPIVPR